MCLRIVLLLPTVIESLMAVPSSAGGDSGDAILFALIGASPGVLSETVWSLAHENPPTFPQRIVVITTTVGRERIRRTFFQKREWEGFTQSLRRSVRLPPGVLQFGDTGSHIRVFPSLDGASELADIRTEEDSLSVAEFILRELRAYTEDPSCRVVASLAGGRKTSGALLHSALSLIGRERDRLVHVLVSDPWEQHEEFLYPGCPGVFRDSETGANLDSSDARVTLTNIPFVPLRTLFQDRFGRLPGTFDELLRTARSRIARASAPSLVVDPVGGRAYVDGIAPALSPLEFATLFVFSDRLLRNLGPLPSYKVLFDHLQDYPRLYGREIMRAEWFQRASGADSSEDGRKWMREVKKKLSATSHSLFDWNASLPRRGSLMISLLPSQISIQSSTSNDVESLVDSFPQLQT